MMPSKNNRLHDKQISDNKNLLIKKGKLLSISRNQKIVYENYTIYDLNNKCKRCILPHTFIQKLFSYNRLLTRIFRLEPRACIKISEYKYLLSFNSRILSVDLDKNSVSVISDKRTGFSTVLNFCKDEKYIYWGDYGSNPNREEVNIYQVDQTLTPKIIYTFPKGHIRHIHNIIYDKNKEIFWILTGDKEPNSGIYIANKSWDSVMPFKVGAQKYRAVIGFPSKDGLIYATDSVESDNYIYHISEDGHEKNLGGINGSCIYGTSIKEKYIFSTTVESHEASGLISRELGGGIKNREVHLIAMDKTNYNLKIVKKAKKDNWPYKLMQYGSFMFPIGQEDSDDLWCTVMGCEKIDGKNLYLESSLFL